MNFSGKNELYFLDKKHIYFDLHFNMLSCFCFFLLSYFEILRSTLTHVSWLPVCQRWFSCLCQPAYLSAQPEVCSRLSFVLTGQRQNAASKGFKDPGNNKAEGHHCKMKRYHHKPAWTHHNCPSYSAVGGERAS